MKYTVEFDDRIFSLEEFRFRVLRFHHLQQHVPELMKRQMRNRDRTCGRDFRVPFCPHCGGKLFKPMCVHHITTVRWFADHVEIPLDEAYRKCNSLDNMQLLHVDCHKTVHAREAKEPPWQGFRHQLRQDQTLDRAATRYLRQRGYDSTGCRLGRKPKPVVKRGRPIENSNSQIWQHPYRKY